MASEVITPKRDASAFSTIEVDNHKAKASNIVTWENDVVVYENEVVYFTDY